MLLCHSLSAVQLFVQWLTGVLLVELLLLLTHSLVDNVIGCVGTGWVLLLMARILFSVFAAVCQLCGCAALLSSSTIC